MVGYERLLLVFVQSYFIGDFWYGVDNVLHDVFQRWKICFWVSRTKYKYYQKYIQKWIDLRDFCMFLV